MLWKTIGNFTNVVSLYTFRICFCLTEESFQLHSLRMYEDDKLSQFLYYSFLEFKVKM
jgi:hypothetical protein